MYKIPATTLFLGKNLIFMPECHSTNDEMLLLCQQQRVPEGTLIVTANQTAGRGQRGNVWETAPGKNLTFTFLLQPGFLALQKQFYLNIFVALGISDFLTNFGLAKVHIKWPNDILVDGKKVAGILIENQIVGSRMSNSVVGIGLNVNQESFSIPTATSILQVKGAYQDLNSVLTELLKALEARFLQLKNGQFEQLLELYLKRLFRKDELHRFNSSGQVFEGIIRGIDSTGRLLVEQGIGLRSFDIKEIRFEDF